EPLPLFARGVRSSVNLNSIALIWQLALSNGGVCVRLLLGPSKGPNISFFDALNDASADASSYKKAAMTIALRMSAFDPKRTYTRHVISLSGQKPGGYNVKIVADPAGPNRAFTS